MHVSSTSPHVAHTSHTARPVQVLSRAMNQGLNRGFQAWLELLDNLSETARQQRGMGSVVHRFTLRGASRALNQWTSVWRERQRFKVLARKMGANGYGNVSRAWRQWLSLSDELTHRKGIASRFMNVGLTRGFNRWLEMISDKARMAKVLRRALNGGLARGFNQWLEMTVAGAFARASLVADPASLRASFSAPQLEREPPVGLVLVWLAALLEPI